MKNYREQALVRMRQHGEELPASLLRLRNRRDRRKVVEVVGSISHPLRVHSILRLRESSSR